MTTGRTIALATLVAGTLDILSAFIFAGTVDRVLRTVASGPFGDAIADGPAGVPLGLLTHFAIMAVMVAAYVLASLLLRPLTPHWIVAGLVYGFVLWIVMYWIVMPLRWGYATPSETLPIARQLFSHCILTGLPIAWFVARHFKIRPVFR